MADDADAARLPDEPLATAGPRSTHFRFAHRLFAVKGAHFRLSPATDEPVLFVTPLNACRPSNAPAESSSNPPRDPA